MKLIARSAVIAEKIVASGKTLTQIAKEIGIPQYALSLYIAADSKVTPRRTFQLRKAFGNEAVEIVQEE